MSILNPVPVNDIKYITIQPLQIVEILILAILGAVGGFIGSYLRQRISIKTI